MTTPTEELEARIRGFIARSFLFDADRFPYSDDASLLQEGVIDSLGVMQLVEFVQAEFCIAVGEREVTPENFDSVNKLAAFVRSKHQTQAHAAPT